MVCRLRKQPGTLGTKSWKTQIHTLSWQRKVGSSTSTSAFQKLSHCQYPMLSTQVSGGCNLRILATDLDKNISTQNEAAADQCRGVISKPSLAALQPCKNFGVVFCWQSNIIPGQHFVIIPSILKDLNSDLSSRLLECVATLLCVSISLPLCDNDSNIHSSSFLVNAPFLS